MNPDHADAIIAALAHTDVAREILRILLAELPEPDGYAFAAVEHAAQDLGRGRDALDELLALFGPDVEEAA